MGGRPPGQLRLTRVRRLHRTARQLERGAPARGRRTDPGADQLLRIRLQGRDQQPAAWRHPQSLEHRADARWLLRRRAGTLATDSGGSTRRPAAHTGLVGFKPTTGRIPHPWGFADPTQPLNAIGQIGRNVADVRLMFTTLAGHHGGYPLASPAPLIEEAPALRIAWSPDLGLGHPLDAEVRACLEGVIARLRDAGWQVADAAPAWPAQLADTNLMALQHAGLYELFGERHRHDPQCFDPAIAAQIEAGADISGAAVVRLQLLRERIVATMAEFFETHDLLLCPTVPCEPWPLEQLGPAHIGGLPAGPRGHAVFTPLFNHAGTPALSLPCGLGTRGLPLGLQLVGPRFADLRVLEAASRIEALLGPLPACPLLTP
ncbi:amidase [Candidatus Dactylopiibacterium carminicum]|uniref:Amidase n=1 Tax=Candidatus Dactylopiibacterium carminicum TaxID=857335 RepID=A0ABQ7HRS7_9RHOO|nr:amidase [Candidatus Dactylopiibacterium carminicum]